MKEKALVTDQGESIFTFFLNKVESIGLAVTKTDRSYFLLDSGDYWYDSIQSKYPSELRCKCTCNTFTAKCMYSERQDHPDFDQVDLVTKCTSCEAEKTQLAFSLKYSPTEHLYDTPLIYCPKPKIKYKVSEVTSFWTTSDASSFVRLMDSFGLRLTVWYFLGEKRVLSEVNLNEALRIVESKKYLNMFFSVESLRLNVLEGEKGIYFEEDVWRRHELVQLSSPTNMQYARDRVGFLYYTRFCNEFIEDYLVKSKSREFEKVTDKVTAWLRSTFYTGRGKHCADNKSECIRLFGDRFGT